MHFEPGPCYCYGLPAPPLAAPGPSYGLAPPWDARGAGGGYQVPGFASATQTPEAPQWTAPGFASSRETPSGRREPGRPRVGQRVPGVFDEDDPWGTNAEPSSPPDPGGFFDPTPEALAVYEDIKRRWLLMSTWTTAGPVTGKIYTFFGFPQFKIRWDFWLPWAQAWEAGNRDVTMLIAQRSNLNGAELEARHENEIMRNVNRQQAARTPPGWTMRLIPLYDAPLLDAPGVASSTPALKAAAEVDRIARDIEEWISEHLPTIPEVSDLGWGLGALLAGAGVFLLARAAK